jgi:hypothetical protein
MAIIDKPSDYFNTVLYTGTGLAGQAQTGCRISTRFSMDKIKK